MQDLSQRNFLKIIENSHLGITLIDSNFNLLYRSPSAERIIGLGKASTKGFNLLDYIDKQDITPVKALLERIVCNPDYEETTTVRWKHAEGQSVWLECTFTNSLFDPDIQCIVCNYIDVTARINAEKNLTETLVELSAYKYALDESAIVAVTDQRGLIRHVNDKFCQISGYSRDDLIGRDHQIINSGYHEKSFIKSLWQTIAQGKIWRGELRNKAKDGTFYWVDTSIVPFLDKNNKPYQYMAIRYDITERKSKELDLERSNKQIIELLETISDGFVRLDAQLQCTYANEQVARLLKKHVSDLIGKNIWQVLPKLIGSKTYQTIQYAHQAQEFASHEDYYAPLGLWYESRIYPSEGGLFIFIRDISSRKKEEHHLKLLESVITNTTDAVMITTAHSKDKPGVEILYVNTSFGKMTGYIPEEIIGRSPKFLQGEKTDPLEVDRLNKAMLAGESCECTLLNYKKNGVEFWNHLSVSPVIDAYGLVTHFIAIEHDVTHFKNEELQKNLLAEFSMSFASASHVKEGLTQTLEKLMTFGDFCMGEVWLVNGDNLKLDLVARHSTLLNADKFYEETNQLTSFIKGDGLPGHTWACSEILYWKDLQNEPLFLRANAAKKFGIKSAYGIPLIAGEEFIGALILGLTTNDGHKNVLVGFFEKYSKFLSLEIKRKQLEEELSHLFNYAPDVICIIGTDRQIKKVNVAMCNLLGYTHEELSGLSINDLIHPEDLNASKERMINFIQRDEATLYYENRYLTKSGQIKYLSWTAMKESSKNQLICVAKDVTEKKELERILDTAAHLAKIGGWQLDPNTKQVYWSPSTRRILEVGEEEAVDFEFGLKFYRNQDQVTIREKLNETIRTGESFDCEFEIETALGNLKWIRVIGNSEFLNGRCMRLYGSFQDIDDLKRAEIAAKESFLEKNTILESIGDAFFAIDRNWQVTYWNQKATQMLDRPKAKVIGKNLWDSFPEAINSVSYHKYHEAMDTGAIVHFEDYFETLKTWYGVNVYPSEKGLSVFFKDITERVKYIKQIEAHNEKLREISWMQSHVIRAPLSRIMGLAELMRNTDLAIEDRSTTIEYLLQSAYELDEVIKGITLKTTSFN